MQHGVRFLVSGSEMVSAEDGPPKQSKQFISNGLERFQGAPFGTVDGSPFSESVCFKWFWHLFFAKERSHAARRSFSDF